MARMRVWGFVLAGLVVALFLAGIVSGFASSEPDGLEKVAGDEGFIDTAENHDLADSPVADYGIEGVENDRLSTGLAGLIGVVVTFGVGCALFLLVRGRSQPSEGGGEGSASDEPPAPARPKAEWRH